jgi:hypothetical protein
VLICTFHQTCKALHDTKYVNSWSSLRSIPAVSHFVLTEQWCKNAELKLIIIYHIFQSNIIMCKNMPLSYSRNIIEFWYKYQVYTLKYMQVLPVPEGELYKVWVCGRLLSGIAGSNSAADVDVCLYFSVVCSGRCLCVGLITRPEESYRLWCVWVRSWRIDIEEVLAHWGLLRCGEKTAVLTRFI